MNVFENTYAFYVLTMYIINMIRNTYLYNVICDYYTFHIFRISIYVTKNCHMFCRVFRPSNFNENATVLFLSKMEILHII